MPIAGKRGMRTRLIHTQQFVVAVEVEVVTPPDDPSEPCYEPETVQFLREVEERAKHGDIDWLNTVGKVYQAVATSNG